MHMINISGAKKSHYTEVFQSPRVRSDRTVQRLTCFQVEMDDPAEVEEIERLCDLQEDVSAAVLPPVEFAASLAVQCIKQIPRHLFHHQQHRVSLHH